MKISHFFYPILDEHFNIIKWKRPWLQALSETGILWKIISIDFYKKLKTDDVFLKQLNYKFISNFEVFLIKYYPIGYIKAMRNNSVMKHLQRLRKIATSAYHLEWVDKNPLIRGKPTSEPKQSEFLSAHELSNLETYSLPLERLNLLEDLFIFSCYAGMSYEDIVKLTRNNIILRIDGSRRISSKRQKTKAPVKIALLEKVEGILKKYIDDSVTIVSQTLLPVLTNEKINLCLKEIADAMGIKKAGPSIWPHTPLTSPLPFRKGSY